MKNMLQLNDVSKIYRTKAGNVHALDHVSFHVREGEFVSVIGQSGSGKSTLMNILGCLDQPSEGEYLLDDIPVSAMKERRLSLIRNTMIGFIFQSFHLIPSLSALENVELPLIYRGLRRRERFFLANSALERVGLANRLTHKPSELSGGQQQRVAIARAIALRPKLILADEPTGNLDSRSGEGIMDILKSLHREGSAMVIITHDPKIAVMAERCIKISDGRILN